MEYLTNSFRKIFVINKQAYALRLDPTFGFGIDNFVS
jgi:hypothetical protein